LIVLGTARHDGVKAAQRAYHEARAAVNAASQQTTERLQTLATRIAKMDSVFLYR